MTRHPGGGTVEGGWYLDTRRMALVSLPAPGTLPGSPRDSFVRVPWPALLLLAPWVGGAFVLVGPLVGLAAATWGLARWSARAASAGARGLAPTRHRVTAKRA